jgi:hypothetical protein
MGTHDASVCGLPPLRLEFFADLHKHLLVLWVGHLLVHPEIVAGHIIGCDLEVLRVRWIHPVDIDVHWNSNQRPKYSAATDVTTHTARPASGAMFDQLGAAFWNRIENG